MSPRSSDAPSTPGIYDGLLGAALIAVIVGVFMLYFELSQYDWKAATGG